MYQPPYMQNEPYHQSYQPYQQQQPQQQQTTYEYKPVTAQEVYPVETDAGQPEKRERERPDYRPIPLRWPFISALILVLLGLMGLIIYATRTLNGDDKTAKLESRSFRITNEDLFYMKRQDVASEPSQPDPTADTGTEESQASEPEPEPVPTDDIPTATGDVEGGTLTTALVESVFTTMVTEPGSIEVSKTTETITETGETTLTETITEAASTFTSFIPEESVPPEEWQPTTVVQPGQTKTLITVKENGAVRTTVRETTRTGPPIVYASVGTTTIYSVLTIDSEGKVAKPPVTRVRTSEVAATVKTVVDAPPPVTMVQTLADGQVITSVSTPIGTTRVTTVPPTKVVVTDVETPTGDTKIVVEATTHTLTHSGYFIGKFLPPIVAVLLAMGIRALNQSAQQYQPFAALTRQGGALGREALLLSFDGWMSIYLPFKLLFNNQPLPFLTALAMWASSVAAPLSSEAVGLKIYGSCKKGAIDGCALELGVSKISAYALVGLLGAIAILLMFTLSVISRHWRTGVFANPWCAANTAALVARNPEIRSMGAQDWKDLKGAVTEKRFAMGWFRNQEGRDEYGLVVVGDANRDIIAPYGNTPYEEGMAYRPQTRRRAPQTFMALSFWYRFTFLVFLICLLGFISYYHFVDTFSHLPKNMKKLMESQDFGVRFVCSALGVIVVFCWEFLFTSVAVITPYRRMAEDPQVPTRSVLMTPATNPVSGFFVALRIRDPLLFFTAFTTLLAQFLPILLANVPYSLTQTSEAHEICSRLSIGILLIMVIAMLSSLLVKWPDLPVDPRSLAGALWYVADAPWVRGLEGVAAMSARKRKEAVQGLGGSWTHPYAGGRDFVRPHIKRGRGRGQPQGSRNATPGPSYGQQQWEYEQPALYPQGYDRVSNYYQLAPQQLPLTAVTLYPQPLYAEPLSAAVNNAIRLSLNANYPQHQDQPAIQSQSESHSQEVHPEQAPRGTKRKNNTEHGEQTNMTHVADQDVFGDHHGSMYEENAINQGVDYGLLKAKGHASFINHEATIQAIEGMFQRGEPITLSWNSEISTVTPNTAPQMPSHTAKRQRVVSAQDSLTLKQADPNIYFKLRDANTYLKAAANPTICGNCQCRGHTVATCHRVSEYGFIRGCAICNTSCHNTWNCPEFPKNDRHEIVNIMVFSRANLPPLVGKFWYSMLFDYMQENPDTFVPGLPWSLQHSKRFYISHDIQDPFLLGQHRCITEQLGGVDPRTFSWENTKAYYNK
ncbi:hypothetical protein FPHYL_528 [Fusarium phyllophilum]|uniref:Zonadhesin n=1 Tax=Fusarium phyllophilum TaxID=47803 RepID=A0A8H5KFU5_9HYPO|nr:hypothetical protein FPHYL_528 [Fusarium phyllophilum]